MPITRHMKLLVEEAEIEHQYRRRVSHLDDPTKSKHFNYAKDPKVSKRIRFLDDTKEHLDYNSNIDVGTRYRHLQYASKGIARRGNTARNFNHIVDLDSQAYQKIVCNRFLKEILASRVFRGTILILVILNAVLIGFNTVAEFSEKYETIFEFLDQVLFTIFLVEVLIKWVYDFHGFWIIYWNILDFAIIVMITYSLLVPVFLDSKSALVLVRVGRALRSLRSLSVLSSLNVVSTTIFKSVIDMVNILFVLIIFMVVMAIAGVVFFDDESLKTSRFLSALDAWFVLFICVTQDGWIEVLDQFRQLEKMFLAIALYLILGVTIGAFVFANLIVAVVVANLESSIRQLKEEKVKTDNPLIYYDEFSPNKIDILPTYRPFMNDKPLIFGQRPFSKPTVRNSSRRKLMCYIMSILALEQNLLEYSAIEHDFIRFLSVILSISNQMENGADKMTEEQLRLTMDMAKATYYTNQAQAQVQEQLLKDSAGSRIKFTESRKNK